MSCAYASRVLHSVLNSWAENSADDLDACEGGSIVTRTESCVNRLPRYKRTSCRRFTNPVSPL